MKKRFLSLLLALSLLTIPAYAAENSMDNFIRDPAQTYAGQFPDVPADHTFYHNIAALYELGLTKGKADGTFGLTDNIPVSQVVIFAARVRSLFRTGDPEAGANAHPDQEGEAVVAPYLRYLQAEGLLGTELDEVLFSPATRAQVAHVLANLLPEEALPAINGDIITEAYARRLFITDVDEYTPYQADILKLYRCGISQGSNETGDFFANQPITRGAVAAMLTRLADTSLRIKLRWAEPEVPNVSEKNMANIIEPGQYYSQPATAEELDSSVRYMLFTGSDQLRLRYPDLTMTEAQQVMTETLAVVKGYCEQGYNTVNAEINSEGILMVFSSGSTDGKTDQYRAATLAAAKEVHDWLWANGHLTNTMTEREKAAVYYHWICLNCVYDHGAGEHSLSHIPYSLFALGTAVCDGYTGAYNLLLKLEGIDCHAYLTEDHIWTVAILDGQAVHIDTTWGDIGDSSLPLYFAMTPELSLQLHKVTA